MREAPEKRRGCVACARVAVPPSCTLALVPLPSVHVAALLGLRVSGAHAATPKVPSEPLSGPSCSAQGTGDAAWVKQKPPSLKEASFPSCWHS